MKNLFTLKCLGAGDFYQTREGLYFKEEVIAILHKLIQIWEEGGTHTYLFYCNSTIWYQNLTKNVQEKNIHQYPLWT